MDLLFVVRSVVRSVLLDLLLLSQYRNLSYCLLIYIFTIAFVIGDFITQKISSKDKFQRQVLKTSFKITNFEFEIGSLKYSGFCPFYGLFLCMASTGTFAFLTIFSDTLPRRRR